jgi:hypothetical protein
MRHADEFTLVATPNFVGVDNRLNRYVFQRSDGVTFGIVTNDGLDFRELGVTAFGLTRLQIEVHAVF